MVSTTHCIIARYKNSTMRLMMVFVALKPACILAWSIHSAHLFIRMVEWRGLALFESDSHRNQLSRRIGPASWIMILIGVTSSLA